MGLRVNKRGFATCSGLEEIDSTPATTATPSTTAIPATLVCLTPGHVEKSKRTLRSPARCGFWNSTFSFTMKYGSLGFAHQKRQSLSGS